MSGNSALDGSRTQRLIDGTDVSQFAVPVRSDAGHVCAFAPDPSERHRRAANWRDVVLSQHSGHVCRETLRDERIAGVWIFVSSQ